MSATLKDLVDAVDGISGNSGLVCFYTGCNVNSQCAEQLAHACCIRSNWIAQSSELSDDLSPVYVPVIGGCESSEEDVMKDVGAIARMCATLGLQGINYIDGNELILDGTDGILSIDTDISSPELTLVYIHKDYEKFLADGEVEF